jgi:L-alanine-DL-glutamate epimerase-like enolase superfamily enzyme
MARVKAATRVTITADESVMCAVDVATVARMRAADMVTIKLARVGGIREALRMVEVARSAGLGCNMGSKHTFGVGTAAILHFCAAIDYVSEPLGYGSPRERFVDDIIEEEIPFARGIASAPEGAGLGVTLCEETLERYCVGAMRWVGN